MQRQRGSNKPWIRTIDFVFYNEQDIRLAVMEARNSGATAPVIKNASGVSDPTARDAIYNLSPIPAITLNGRTLSLPERWLTVIDKTYAWCSRQSETHLQVAKRRYRGEGYLKTCMECHISKSLLSTIMYYVKLHARMYAIQSGLIPVD